MAQKLITVMPFDTSLYPTDLATNLNESSINRILAYPKQRSLWINGWQFGHAYIDLGYTGTKDDYPEHGEVFNYYPNYQTINGAETLITGNRAKGKYSSAFGFTTRAVNDCEMAVGRFNYSDRANNVSYPHKKKSIFTVGVGTIDNLNMDNVPEGAISMTNQHDTYNEYYKNAFRVNADGTIYIAEAEEDIQINNIKYNPCNYDGKSVTGKEKSLQRILSDVEKMQKITYEDLLNLRSTNNLVPGMQYRIINYATTVGTSLDSSGTNRPYKSGIFEIGVAKSKPFDIIVTANSENSLSQIARADYREGSTLLNDADVPAWKLWYTLDNNTNDFAWADDKFVQSWFKIKNTDGKSVYNKKFFVAGEEQDNYIEPLFKYENAAGNLTTEFTNEGVHKILQSLIPGDGAAAKANYFAFLYEDNYKYSYPSKLKYYAGNATATVIQYNARWIPFKWETKFAEGIKSTDFVEYCPEYCILTKTINPPKEGFEEILLCKNENGKSLLELKEVENNTIKTTVNTENTDYKFEFLAPNKLALKLLFNDNSVETRYYKYDSQYFGAFNEYYGSADIKEMHKWIRTNEKFEPKTFIIKNAEHGYSNRYIAGDDENQTLTNQLNLEARNEYIVTGGYDTLLGAEGYNWKVNARNPQGICNLYNDYDGETATAQAIANSTAFKTFISNSLTASFSDIHKRNDFTFTISDNVESLADASKLDVDINFKDDNGNQFAGTLTKTRKEYAGNTYFLWTLQGVNYCILTNKGATEESLNEIFTIDIEGKTKGEVEELIRPKLDFTTTIILYSDYELVENVYKTKTWQYAPDSSLSVWYPISVAVHDEFAAVRAQVYGFGSDKALLSDSEFQRAAESFAEDAGYFSRHQTCTFGIAYDENGNYENVSYLGRDGYFRYTLTGLFTENYNKGIIGQCWSSPDYEYQTCNFPSVTFDILTTTMSKSFMCTCMTDDGLSTKTTYINLDNLNAININPEAEDTDDAFYLFSEGTQPVDYYYKLNNSYLFHTYLMPITYAEYYVDPSGTKSFHEMKYNGKGVIYRMIDEWGNDLPYDFKNITFSTTGSGTNYTNMYTFSLTDNNALSGEDYSLTGNVKNNTIRPIDNNICGNIFTTFASDRSGTGNDDSGTGGDTGGDRPDIPVIPGLTDLPPIRDNSGDDSGGTDGGGTSGGNTGGGTSGGGTSGGNTGGGTSGGGSGGGGWDTVINDNYKDRVDGGLAQQVTRQEMAYDTVYAMTRGASTWDATEGEEEATDGVIKSASSTVQILNNVIVGSSNNIFTNSVVNSNITNVTSSAFLLGIYNSSISNTSINDSGYTVYADYKNVNYMNSIINGDNISLNVPFINNLGTSDAPNYQVAYSTNIDNSFTTFNGDGNIDIRKSQAISGFASTLKSSSTLYSYSYNIRNNPFKTTAKDGSDDSDRLNSTYNILLADLTNLANTNIEKFGSTAIDNDETGINLGTVFFNLDFYYENNWLGSKTNYEITISNAKLNIGSSSKPILPVVDNKEVPKTASGNLGWNKSKTNQYFLVTMKLPQVKWSEIKGKKLTITFNVNAWMGSGGDCYSITSDGLYYTPSVANEEVTITANSSKTTSSNLTLSYSNAGNHRFVFGADGLFIVAGNSVKQLTAGGGLVDL